MTLENQELVQHDAAQEESARPEDGVAHDEELQNEEAAEEESDQEEGDSHGEDDSTAQPKQKGYPKRIAELTWRANEAKREADVLREQNARMLALLERATGKQQPEPVPAAPQPQTLVPPKWEDFESEEDFQSAMVDYRVELKLQQRDQKAQEQQKQQQQQQSQAEMQRVWNERVAAQKAQFQDFDSVVYGSKVPITDAMASAIMASEQGPAIAYHLGSNPTEAARIAKLEPYAAAAAIGRLETTLTKLEPRKITNAPPPIKTVNGQGSSPGKDPLQMSQVEFRKYWAEQKKQRMK